MKLATTIIALCSMAFCVNANAQKYPFTQIPDSLTKDANVVVRSQEIVVEIKSDTKAKMHTKYAYTVLNEEGVDYAHFADSYDKFNEINSIDGELYDANGKELKGVKKKDIADYSGNDQSSLMVDTRYKVHNFYYRSFPYTVEYEEDNDINSLFFLSFVRWQPQTDAYISVQYSKFTVITPNDYNLRYKQKLYSGAPTIVKGKETTVYTWELKGVPAKKNEYFSPSFDQITTSVKLAPSTFELQGYKGDMSSWEKFGLFRTALIGGRDELDEATKVTVHRLTDTVTDFKRKVDVLYKYMQQNTRYISVSLGIGGWQPFDAKYVAAKKYGDCKALSNFMGALLKEAHVNSLYAVIKSGNGKYDFDEDFPSNQFNHAINCAVAGKDTIWLECTDQTLPTGYLSDFTANRPVLLIGNNGGKLVHTPKYTIKDNIVKRNINVVLDESGNLKGQMNTMFSGTEYDDTHNAFVYKSKEDQLKDMKEDLPNYDLSNLAYKEYPAAIPSIEEDINIQANNYASITGKRLFVVPNIMNKESYKLPDAEKRVNDIVYKFSYKHLDTIHLQMPSGYTIEARPKDVEIENKFGKYAIKFLVNGDAIDCIRYYERNEGRYPAADYDSLVKFYSDMYKADRSKLVFVKKEN